MPAHTVLLAGQVLMAMIKLVSYFRRVGALLFGQPLPLSQLLFLKLTGRWTLLTHLNHLLFSSLLLCGFSFFLLLGLLLKLKLALWL